MLRLKLVNVSNKGPLDFESHHSVHKDDMESLIAIKIGRTYLGIMPVSNLIIILVITVTADDLAPSGARASAGTVMTTFDRCTGSILEDVISEYLPPHQTRMGLWRGEPSNKKRRETPISRGDRACLHVRFSWILFHKYHNNDVINSAMVSQITSLSIVYPNV